MANEVNNLMKSVNELTTTPESEKVKTVFETYEKLADHIITTSSVYSGFEKQPTPAMQEAKHAAYRNGDSNGSPSNAKMLMKMARTKMINARMQVNKARDREDEMYKTVMKGMEEIQAIVMELKNFQIQGRSLKEILDLIKKAIPLLSRLKENWGRMLDFFSTISNFIKTNMAGSMKRFTDDGYGALKDTTGNGPSWIIRKEIWGLNYEATKHAYVVHALAETYHQISDKVGCQ